MAKSIIKDKSDALAVRIVRLSRYLTTTKREFIISGQIYRSGTSISANVNEAQQGSSKNDFVHKMNIALKEASETKHWLRLLYKTDYINKIQFDSIYDDATEVEKILTKIVKTTRENIEKEEKERKRESNDKMD